MIDYELPGRLIGDLLMIDSLEGMLTDLEDPTTYLDTARRALIDIHKTNPFVLNHLNERERIEAATRSFLDINLTKSRFLHRKKNAIYNFTLDRLDELLYVDKNFYTGIASYQNFPLITGIEAGVGCASLVYLLQTLALQADKIPLITGVTGAAGFAVGVVLGFARASSKKRNTEKIYEKAKYLGQTMDRIFSL